MTPSQVRMIAFFYDYSQPIGADNRHFISRLDHKEVTYKLRDFEAEMLAAIYDKYVPDLDEEEWQHVSELVQTLKDIETVQLKFKLFDSTDAFDTEVIIP